MTKLEPALLIVNAEQHFIIDRLLPILATVVLTMTVYNPGLLKKFCHQCCSISTFFITRFSELFVPNIMLLVFEIFRTNLFLAAHSETNCISLSVAVISLAVVADVYSVSHPHT